MTDRYPIVYTRRARYRGASIFFSLFILMVVLAVVFAYWYVVLPLVLVVSGLATYRAFHLASKKNKEVKGG